MWPPERLIMRNTLVARNRAPLNNDVSGAFSSLGNNLIGDSTGGGGWDASDILDVAPTLDALADNGGPAQTHALLAGSSGIDEGSNTGAPATDQRGVVRDATTDIGAYEYVGIKSNSTSSAATAGAASSLSWSHTVASGSNRILTVGLSLISGQSTGVTYGATPLTLVGRYTGSHTIEIWQLVAPAVQTADIEATFSGSLEAIGGGAAFNNVDQTTPTGSFQGAEGDSGTASVTIASAPGDVVIDTLFVDLNVTASVGADQAEQWNQANGRLGASSIEAGAASVTMSWGLSPGEEWAIGAVALKPAIDCKRCARSWPTPP